MSNAKETVETFVAECGLRTDVWFGMIRLFYENTCIASCASYEELVHQVPKIRANVVRFRLCAQCIAKEESLRNTVGKGKAARLREVNSLRALRAQMMTGRPGESIAAERDLTLALQ